MPLIVLCGLPCSGKTTRANQLKQFFETSRNIKAVIIGDDDNGVHRNEIYKDSSSEKQFRSILKSQVQRSINKEDVLIFDSLNYIKGYRYEVYCIIKSAQTPQCVVHCDIAPSQASQWNLQRPEHNQYRTDIFDGLVMRFEPPDSRNRWDSPLFLVHPDEELLFEDVHQALFTNKAPPPNHSTLPQPLSATNFLHELDTMTQSVIKGLLKKRQSHPKYHPPPMFRAPNTYAVFPFFVVELPEKWPRPRLIVDSQKAGLVGGQLSFPGSNEKVVLNRTLSMMELQRLRREFIAFTKIRPVDDASKISNMFIQFLNGRTQ